MQTRRLLPLLICAALVAVGCSEDAGSKAKGGKRAPAASTSPCTPGKGEKTAKVLLRCAAGSVAYVSNPMSTGTGVVVEEAGKRYVLTNLHVVDPFDSADVTFGSTTLRRVPVVGVDANADITLLGPLDDDDRAPIPLGGDSDVESGDDVYLVGYPGESGGTNTSKPKDLEATIARGIVSRTRKVDEFEQRFIQTDASISGGQSGGPLFDDRGRLVGISGLSFADEFALALVTSDVRESIARILDGKGHDYLALPLRPEGGDGSGTLRIADSEDGQLLYLPPADEDRTLRLSVSGDDTVVSVSSLVEGAPLAVSSNSLRIYQEVENRVAARRGGTPESLPDAAAMGLDAKVQAREVAPGRFEVPIAADDGAVVYVERPLADAPGEVTWSSDLPLLQVTSERFTAAIQLDEPLDHVFTAFDDYVELTLDLEEGERIEVHARSATGDTGFDLIAPSVTLDAVTRADREVDGIENVDDTDDGIYGVDARKVLTATETGTYRIHWYTNDGVTEMARISVRKCSSSSCRDPE